MKKGNIIILGLLIMATGLFFYNCATKIGLKQFGTGQSEIFLEASHSKYINQVSVADQYRIYIDGKNIGIMEYGGANETINVTNGRHVLKVEFRYYSSPGSLAGGWTEWRTIGSLNIELEYERVHILLDPRSNLSEKSRERISSPELFQRLDATAAKSFDTISQNIPSGSKIAILNFTPDTNESRRLYQALTIKFVNAGKYSIVDRATLETIREEQRFQMSGEVSDDSAVSIGQFLGADVIITGNITGSGNQGQLLLRALSVRTAQIIAMSSEDL